MYNTSSRTTVLSHPVGDTKEERYTTRKHNTRTHKSQSLYCIYTKARKTRVLEIFWKDTCLFILNSSLKFPITRINNHHHNLRSIDRFLKTHNTRLHRSRESVVKNFFLKSALNDASKQNRQDTRFGNTFHTRVSNSFKFILFPRTLLINLLTHEICAKLTSLSLLLSLSHVNSTVNSKRGWKSNPARRRNGLDGYEFDDENFVSFSLFNEMFLRASFRARTSDLTWHDERTHRFLFSLALVCSCSRTQKGIVRTRQD